MILRIYNTILYFTIALSLVIMTIFCTGAKAEVMTEINSIPDDCRSVLSPEKRGTLQSWTAFVELEHCDRIKRLKRLSALLPPAERPRFYEGIVPASRLPVQFGVDIPVLRVVFPDRAFFNTAQAEMRPEANAVLDIVAKSLRSEPPDVALFIAGHADKRGERNYNEGLSIDRANSIAEEIYFRGINLSSIWRIGFGEDMPLNNANNEMAYAVNRRVEFLFAAKPTALAIWLADQQLDELCSARNRAEAELCKEKLNLKDGYDVVEVKFRPKKTKSIKPSLTSPKEVKIAKNESNSIDLIKDGRAKVEPVSAGRIRIEPRNRRVERVRLEL